MLNRLFMILIITLSFTANVQAAGLFDVMSGAHARANTKTPRIKVLIVENSDGVMLETKGKYNIYNPHDNTKLGTRFMGKSYLVQPLLGGIKWGEEFPGVYQLKIVPDEQRITTVIDGVEYRGTIYVYDVNGRISIVNEVALEDYVNSLMSVQIRQAQSPEAMNAIAIVERTKAMNFVSTSTNPFWDVRARDVDYHGYALTGRVNGVEQAINDTRYMIISKSNDKIEPINVGWAFGSKSNAATLSVDEAEDMAHKGMHAAQIISKSFPNTSLQTVREGI